MFIIIEAKLNLSLFLGTPITRESLAHQANIDRLYVHEDFVVDNLMIAVLGLDDCPYGKSIVIHAKLGVFYTDRTSRQLFNEYHDLNGVGFIPARQIAQHLNLPDHLPLVYGHVVYMPMAGKRHKNPDWIGLHMVEKFRSQDDLACFTATNGIEIHLPKKQFDLRTKVHNACLFAETHLQMWALEVSSFGKFSPLHQNVGLTDQFTACLCDVHQLVPKTLAQVSSIRDRHMDKLTRDFSRNDIGIDSAEASKEKIRIYHKMKHY